jgi:hypothetical protein
MLRFAVVFLAAVVTCGTAESAERAIVHPRVHRAAIGLPAGLPRPHYHFRTTITYAAPYIYRRPFPRLSVYEAPAILYAPVVYVEPLLFAPVPDRYVPYWDRLPYACGVYGYC